MSCSPVASAQSGAISQAYQTNTSDITQGALVSIVSSKSQNVELANTNNGANVVGIAANKPILQLSSNSNSSVQVVVSGSTDAYVSDANGAVMVGDKIAASPVDGVGMKASSSTEIVGTALKSLSSVPNVTETVTTQAGEQTKIHVGLIPVAVNIAYFSQLSSEGTISSFVPTFLQNVANSVIGRQVSPLRVLVGAIALLLGFISTTTMLYVSIRSGLISIGRNPLAEGALRKGLVDVIIAATGVLLITVVIVYAILLT